MISSYRLVIHPILIGSIIAGGFLTSLRAQSPSAIHPVTGNPAPGSMDMHQASSEVLAKADNNDLTFQETHGRNAWVAVPHFAANPGTSSAYFMAPDYLRNITTKHPVRVELIYLDEAPGLYNFTYDSQDPSQKPGVGKSLAPLQTTGTGGWKSARWDIGDPHFTGGLNGGDLKLESQGPLPLTVLGIYLDSGYPMAEDSKPQPNVPHGDTIKFRFSDSKIFPGTHRDVTVYVPKQYDGTTPACVWVEQDGPVWNGATVLDNLIAKKELPVMIEIAISPGNVDYPGNNATGKPGAGRGNRQYEYDVVSDDYVRFLLEELFPAVEQQKTPDGRQIKLSKSGNDRGICGTSSGGICAFNAAWQRPDAFTRVLSAIGSFDNLHNGDRFPGLIRKTEPKAIRVFLQDGSNDLNWFAGDWFLANQRMERALEWAGYDHKYIWGDRGHDAAQAINNFPDEMRYLWKDWPEPVKAGASRNDSFGGLFGKNKEWHQVWEGKQAPPSLAANAKGEVFFNDPSEGKCYKIDGEGKLSAFASTNGDAGQAFGSDGRLYQVESKAGQIVAYDTDGKSSVIATGIRGDGIVALPHNRFYVSEPGREGAESRIWLIGADGSKKMVDGGDYRAGALGIDAPGYSYLSVADPTSHWVYSIQALPDGTLQYRQRYTQLEEPVIEASAAAKGLYVEVDGTVIAATQSGLQIGSGSIVKGIVPVPGGAATGIALGGPALDTFYVISGNKIYTRKTNLRAIPLPADDPKPVGK